MNRDLKIKDQTGQKHRLIIAELRPEQFPVFISLMEREEELAALCAGVDLEFIKGLPTASVMDIVEASRQLNTDLALRFVRSRCQALEGLLPALNYYEKAKPVIAEVMKLFAELESK